VALRRRGKAGTRAYYLGPHSASAVSNFTPPHLGGGSKLFNAHSVDMNNFALLRALASEQRARDASDPAIRKEWEALAIEWHLLANTTEKMNNKVSQAKSG